MRKGELLLAAGAMAVVSAFWSVRTAGYEFIRMDDPEYVVENASVQAGLGWEGVKWSFANVATGSNWHPLTWLSLMADADLSDGGLGSMCAVMHRHNAVLHGFCAALLFLVMMRFAGAAAGWRDFAVPFLLTLIWALHPLRAECVCWVTERKELLCAAFSLLAILAWDSRKTALGLLAAILAYAAALLSKSVAVTLPVLLIALDLIRDGDWRRTVRRMWWVWGVLFALAAVVIGFTLAAQAEAITGSEDVSVPMRVTCAFGAYASHLCRAVVPVNLFFYRPFATCVNWWLFVPGVLLVGSMLLATLVYFAGGMRRDSGAELGFLTAAWVGAGLVPMSGIVRVGIEMDPDRFGHWIGAGLAVVLAIALRRHVRGAVARIAPAALAVLLAVYAAGAWRHAETFRDNYRLFANTVRLNPRHAQGLSQLGYEYAMRFRACDRAIDLTERSLALQAEDDTASQLVTLLSLRGRPGDHARIKELCKAVIADRSRDDRGGALTALGVVAMREHRWDDAISFFEDANRRRERLRMPMDDNRIRIAMCRFNKGDLDGAADLFRSLGESSPDEAIRGRSRELLQRIWQRRTLTNETTRKGETKR